MAVLEVSYLLPRLIGVITSDVGSLSSTSIAALMESWSFRGEMVGECSASLLLGFLDKEKCVR